MSTGLGLSGCFHKCSSNCDGISGTGTSELAKGPAIYLSKSGFLRVVIKLHHFYVSAARCHKETLQTGYSPAAFVIPSFLIVLSALSSSQILGATFLRYKTISQVRTERR